MSDLLRDTIADLHHIPESHRDLISGTDEETMTAQAVRLQAILGTRPKPAGYAPKEGSVRQEGDSDREARDFVADLFNRAD